MGKKGERSSDRPVSGFRTKTYVLNLCAFFVFYISLIDRLNIMIKMKVNVIR